MTITIRLETDNDAFTDNKDAEVARIVSEWLASNLRFTGIRRGDDCPLRDINGNTVGSVKVTGR